jgi:hypothetical protein
MAGAIGRFSKLRRQRDGKWQYGDLVNMARCRQSGAILRSYAQEARPIWVGALEMVEN